MTASTFTIKTVTGDEQMELQLKGRALPYQPFTLEGSMRAEFTWYPGNAVATVQMLGAEEKPSTIEGMWKDRFIKNLTDENKQVIPTGVANFNGQAVADVFALVAAVEKIRLAGQLVRVEWDSITREGILRGFQQSWVRREDVKWQMTFEWASRGEAQVSVTLPSSPSPDAFSKQLSSLSDTLFTATKLPAEFSVVEDFTAAVEGPLADIVAAVAQVQAAVKNSVSQVLSPVDAAQRTLAAVQTVKTAASTIVDVVDSFPPVQLIKTFDLSELGLSDALVASNYGRSVREAARNLLLTAADQSDTLGTVSREEELVASFVSRSPIDLRHISQKYYGTPNEWRRLLTYNGFNSSIIPLGTLVMVPKITFADGRV